MATRKRTASLLRRLHRSMGTFAAMFVIFMVLSGLVINHSDGLGLDQHHITQPVLLDWYGLKEPDQISSFAVGDDWLSFAGSQLYLNDKWLATLPNGVGAVSTHHMLIAAGPDELLLLNAEGILIERSNWNPPGAGPIEAIGLLNNGHVAVQSKGLAWLADADLLSWRLMEDPATTLTWAVSTPVPQAIHAAISQQYRGADLSFERVLLDFHSGRVFGPIGIVIYDLLALAVGFLAISGLLLWLRGRRNGKRRQ